MISELPSLSLRRVRYGYRGYAGTRPSRSWLDVKAQVVEPPHEGQCLLLVVVGDRDEDRPVVRNVHARGLQCLVERAGEFVVVADRLARGLHLRGEVGVQPVELGEGEHRRLT